MAKKTPREIEVKLRIPQLAQARRALRRLRAVGGPRMHERNTLYDTRRQQFRRRGVLLRLRVLNASRGAKGYGVLTFKGPGLRLKGWAAANGRQLYKVREEVEMQVAEPEQMRVILEAMGFVPAFRYEKFRTTYRLPKIPGVHVELDETPVGNFFELEGSPRGIDRAARLLGYAQADYITRSYLALHLEACRRRGEKPRDMLFARGAGRAKK